MVGARPRRAARPSTAVRIGRIAVPGLLLGLATTGVVAASTDAAAPQAVAVPVPAATSAPALVREQPVSRSDLRSPLPSPKPSAAAKPAAKPAPKAKAKATPKPKPEAAAKAKPKPPSLTVVDRKYTRVNLNVRSQDDADSRLLTVLETGSRLSVTSTVRGGWRYISYRGNGAWVKNQYLVETKPKPAAAKSGSGAAGISGAPCAGGSAVESGLTPDAVRVHRALCARYSSVTSYGGVRADSQSLHSSGRAVDAMISDRGTGQAMADWVRANAKRLGVSEVIYAQRIWTVQRSGEGWRSMPDRGSVSANHYDHVHVSVYGNSGG